MKKNIYFLGKLFLIIILSFVISTSLSKVVFLANTPKLNPSFFQNISLRNLRFNLLVFLHNFSRQKNSLIGVSREETIKFLKNNLDYVAPGIKAKTYKNFTVVEVDSNKIKWEKVEYILNDGRKIQVTYPKGTFPPPKDLFEKR